MCACICLYRLPSHPRTMWYLGRAFELVGIILGLENHWLLSFSNTPWRTHQNTLTLTHPHTHKEPHQEVDICTYEGTRNCDRIMYLDGWLLCWVEYGRRMMITMYAHEETNYTSWYRQESCYRFSQQTHKFHNHFLKRNI